ncbi:hypothetical protein DPMN_101079 [Dreissena polymorpha]|uniref:Uncharacterized protein n=1 Tax=Dreissena polymorpha TaxID=45954 RepID=A0A9D4LI94_DREPO|nr:hypothetical protein DPMN_101079 [Dreissena polymorpha]
MKPADPNEYIRIFHWLMREKFPITLATSLRGCSSVHCKEFQTTFCMFIRLIDNKLSAQLKIRVKSQLTEYQCQYSVTKPSGEDILSYP